MNRSNLSLQRLPLFSDLPEPIIAQIKRVAVQRAYGAGEVIILDGLECAGVYFLISGEVGVVRVSSGGREQVLTRLGPGKSFNTVPPFLQNGKNHATVRAMTDAEVICIPCRAFRHLVGESSLVALALLGEFAKRLDHLTALVEDLSLRSVRGRVARFLLEHADGAKMRGRLTQDEIAAQVGTVRDMVGRTLRSFADDGLLRVERSQIVLLDRQEMESEAHR